MERGQGYRKLWQQVTKVTSQQQSWNSCCSRLNRITASAAPDQPDTSYTICL